MTVLLICTACVLSFVAGFAVAWSASRREIRQAQADALDLLYAKQAMVDYVRHGREHAARMVG